jgi:hypothetical protein
MCDSPAHKACAVKARKEICTGATLTVNDAHHTHPKLGKHASKNDLYHSESSRELSVSGGTNGNTILEIFFSDGSSKSIPYAPDIILVNILNHIREEKELDGSYHIYDKSGKIVNNFDQSLKKLKSAFPLFYTTVENSSKTGRKKLRGSGKKKSKVILPTTPETKLAASPHGNFKRRSKSFLGQKKVTKKSLISKDLESLEQRHGSMSITVVTVSDLANQTSAYKLLYFTLTNLDTNQRHRSKLLENTANPTWNQTIKFHMPFSYGQWNIKIWAIRKIDASNLQMFC